jgi:uncharacterized protein (TIGR03382 family)
MPRGLRHRDASDSKAISRLDAESPSLAARAGGSLAGVRGRVAIGLIVMTAACSRTDVGRSRLGLEAYCTATVVGVGDVPVETDYLPNVINCENGGASFEALKVQAVAARSYLYYRLNRTGDIEDGTGDQVYSCSREPSMQHFLAAEATSGQVLQYQGTQVAAFYVAGAKQDPPDCMGGTDDPTNTERFVTYNDGKSGDGIDQTSLGLVNPDNLANRGCMSQNGSDCLSDDGWAYDDIIRFYYGDDIELVQAEGSCVTLPDPPDAGPGGSDDAGGGGSAGGDDLSGGCSTGGSPGIALALAFLLVATRRRLR